MTARETAGSDGLAAAISPTATAPRFVAAVGPLFEHAPGFLYRLAAARPFASWQSLFDRAREIAHAMPEPLQVELIDAHPRLGAAPAAMSAMSRREQGAEDGRVAQELERLNREYEARFGFRYCVFVAGRPRSELIAGMSASLDADRDAELHRAIDAVVNIAADRQGRVG